MAEGATQKLGKRAELSQIHAHWFDYCKKSEKISSAHREWLAHC